MKNREKFRREIIKATTTNNGEELCLFIRDNVIPRYAAEGAMNEDVCGNFDCNNCSQIFSFWLDEEYSELKIPTNLPTDTLIWVRNNENEKWIARYSYRYDKETQKYLVWANGATSKTTREVESYKYAEIARKRKGENYEEYIL